ncbi:MAG TPA: hypothetical protein ENG87_03775 [Candidatus Pacearchaeota archaeon]|nr:hypothetical protein BMS3Abin17_01066 [archaeon BMS3Abin17]HDK42472.1 hypothetical protein [Candidatus Pacearchaeota archaeon]HDZ61279.1 hypothetical protein [Candidatus Pacearchaeota archaeon]
MDREYELLKVKYENARTWLFTLLAVTLSTSIGYYTIEDLTFKLKLAYVTWIVLIGVIFFDILQIVRYNKVINYLKK